jgi:hypothetical protein
MISRKASGERDGKGRALTRFTVDFDPSSVKLDDGCVDVGETRVHPHPGTFVAEPNVKDVLELISGNPSAIVGDDDPSPTEGRGRRHANGTALSDRIARIRE